MATNSNHGKIFVIQLNWHQRSFIFVSFSSDEMLHLQLQKKQTFDAKKKRICFQNVKGGFFKVSVLTLLYAIDKKFSMKNQIFIKFSAKM